MSHVLLDIFRVGLVAGPRDPTNKGSHFREIWNEHFIPRISLNARMNFQD